MLPKLLLLRYRTDHGVDVVNQSTLPTLGYAVVAAISSKWWGDGGLGTEPPTGCRGRAPGQGVRVNQNVGGTCHPAPPRIAAAGMQPSGRGESYRATTVYQTEVPIPPTSMKREIRCELCQITLATYHETAYLGQVYLFMRQSQQSTMA